MKLLAISGTLTGSKTLVAIKKAMDEVKKIDTKIDIVLLNLKDYNIQFCDGREPSDYTGDTRKVIDLVCSADFYIIGTPIMNCSITGALKNLFDLVPASTFKNKVMGFIATGGSDQHYLVVENQLKPLAGYFRAYTAPSYAYINRQHFNEKNEIVDQEAISQINNLVKQVIFMQYNLKEKRVVEVGG